MMKTFFFLIACVCAGSLLAENGTQESLCKNGYALLAASDSSDYRKYAPDRKMDILHVALDVTPDFKQRTVAGTVTMKFKPIAKSLDELRLNGVDLMVSAVTSSEKIQGWQVTDRKSTRLNSSH